MILGAANKNLFGDSYILHGNICPLSINIKKTYETPFSKNKVIFKPLINRDTIRLQKKIGSDQQYFFCAYDNMETLRFFMKLLIEGSRYESNVAAENIKRKLYERIEQDETFGKEEVGAYLFFELIGEKSGYEKCISGKLFLNNVNRLCGNFLGEVVKEIAMSPGKVLSGLNYGFEILNPEYLEKISTELENGEYMKINEIPIKNKIAIEEFIR